MYENRNDFGRDGRNYELMVRYALGMVADLSSEKMHGHGKADVNVKHGVTLECKTGCGWLVSPVFDTPYEAQAVLDSGEFKMLKAMFVAYLPQYNGSNLADTRVLTQKKFLAILAKHGKLRIKKSSANGKWGITIQSYIPTPTFKASQAVYASILHDLDTEGETLEQFANRMGLTQ